MRTRNSRLGQMLLSSLLLSGLACGGGSDNDAGPGGGDGGGGDGGILTLDQAVPGTDAPPSAVDQAAPADEAPIALDQAPAGLDGAVVVDVRAGDAPVVADTPLATDAPPRLDTSIVVDAAIPTDAPVVALDHLKFGPNGEVTVSFSRGSTNTSAWLGLYTSASPDGAYLTYQYTAGAASGSLTFTVPEPVGTYNFRLFADGGYNKIATSPDFVVSYPYDLDPAFATGGRLSFDFLGNGLIDGVAAVIPLASGKLVLAGIAHTGNKDSNGYELNEFALAQLNADGTFDAAFGTGGKAHQAPPAHALGACNAAVVQTDGKIVVGGWGYASGTGTDYVLARFTSAGALDTTFGTGGFVTTNFKSSATSPGENDKLLSIALLLDGRILAAGEMVYAAGSYNNGRPSFARYTAAGAPDTTFGGTGMVTLDPATLSPPGGQSVFDVNSLVVTATGAAFAGITAVSSYGRNDMAIASLKTDGTLDAAFGTAGVLWESRPGVHNNQYLTQLAQTPSGSLLMLGHDAWAWFLGRYTATGASDTAFGQAGQALADFSDSYDYPAGMAQMSDGTIMIGISPDSADGASMSGNMGLVRHDALGNLDGVFGRLRWKWSAASGTIASRALSFATQADGKLLLAGLVQNPGGDMDFAVMRLVKQPGW
jgi:uncharacterized delta-60 repeat protein